MNTSDADKAASALFVSVGLLRRRLRQVMVPGDLTFGEIAALARLERCGPATSADLARQEQISPQSMGATLARLESTGLVARGVDTRDARRVVLSITDAGLRALTTRREARVEQLAGALGTFTKTELRQLLAAAPLIERLADSL
ncbi:MAG: transcriptional regulator [Pseudonocardiales bacterium]|jgi:DNA-binding MarR family transcriptional regulator|nr:transcriptional regulator [Pseudonocardiales bacterium]